MKSSLDMRKMTEKHRRWKAAGPVARRAGLREMARPIFQVVSQKGPRDTNRYVRAYMVASNELGIGLAIPAVKPGHFANEFLPMLRRQVAYWEMRDEQYRRENRTHQKYYRKIQARLMKAREQLQKWDETSIIIFGRASRAQGGGATLTRAVSRVFGGEGRFIDHDHLTFIQIVNKEPHARIVEARIFPEAKQLLSGKAARTVGLKAIKGAHLRVLKAAA